MVLLLVTVGDKTVKGKWLLFPLLFCLCQHIACVAYCVLYPSLFYSIPAFQRMHTARSPSSIPTGVSGDALDLSLSGSQLSMSKRPSSASPGKYFSRSVSVSVASESRGKRNTLVRNCTAVCVLKYWHIVFASSSFNSVTNLFKSSERCQLW